MFSSKTKQIVASRATENIIPQKRAKQIISDVFRDLSKMISCTLGPAGANTLITKPQGTVPIFPCKDGYTVMNNHVYSTPAYESIYRCIRDGSGRMNEVLGDSTTSVTVMMCDYYERIQKYMKRHQYLTPYGVKKIQDNVLKVLTDRLKKDYVLDIKDLKKEDVFKIYEKVATISANNITDIGEKVASAYRKGDSIYSFVDVVESTVAEDIVETQLGFEVTSGPVLPSMANQPDGRTCEYDNPYILLIDGPVITEDLPAFQAYVEFITERMPHPHPLVVVAQEYDTKVMDYLINIRAGVPRMFNGKPTLVKLPVLAIQINMNYSGGLAQLSDLEACLGAKALPTKNGKLHDCPNPQDPNSLSTLLAYVGRADSVKSQYAHTYFKGGAGSDSEKAGRIAELEKLMAEAQESAQHGIMQRINYDNLKKRMGTLRGELHCIKVGGDSFKEKENRVEIFRDAVLAVKACCNNGITLGGNVSINACIKRNKDDIVKEIVDIIESNPRENIGINICKKDILKAVEDILDVVAKSSQAAFRQVFKNATKNKHWVNSIFKSFDENAKKGVLLTYNLITNTEECLDTNIDNFNIRFIPDLIVPGNTDIETLRSVFAIVGLFITSNQLLSVLLQDPSTTRVM